MISLIGSLMAFSVWSAGVQTDQDRPRAGLELSDLTSYRAALLDRPADAPADVSFHDLWDHPETWSGKRVSIRGRVVRVFRQDAVGEFPPLVEAWLSTQRGDLTCMVFPRTDAKSAGLRIGSSVRFAGTYLKTIRYPAGDEPRLAPLVVGSLPPLEEPRIEAVEPSSPSSGLIYASPGTLTIGSAVLTTGALILAWYHLHRPTPERRIPGKARKTPNPGDPPLEFLEPETRTG